MCFTDTAAQASLINSRALQTHTLLLGPPSPGSACAAPQLLGPVAWVTALLDTPTQCGARIERLLYAGHGPCAGAGGSGGTIYVTSGAEAPVCAL